jgi:hypothetical protein
LLNFAVKIPVADTVALFVLDSLIDVTVNSYCISQVCQAMQCQHDCCEQFLQKNFSNVKNFKNVILFKSIFSFRIPTNPFFIFSGD